MPSIEVTGFFYETVRVTLGSFHARRHKNVSCTSDCAKWQSETVTPFVTGIIRGISIIDYRRSCRSHEPLWHSFHVISKVIFDAIQFPQRQGQPAYLYKSVLDKSQIYVKYVRSQNLRLIVVIFPIPLTLYTSFMKKIARDTLPDSINRSR